MKDIRYLLLIIGFIILAHITKKKNSKTEAKFLPDIQDVKEQKLDDTDRIQVLNRTRFFSSIYSSEDKF